MKQRISTFLNRGIFYILFFSLLLHISSSQAAVMVFTDRNQWQASLSGIFVAEDFNSLAYTNNVARTLHLPSGIIISSASHRKTRISDFAFSRIGEGKALQTFQTLDIQYSGQKVLGYGFDYADLDWSGATLSFNDFSISLPMTTDADVSISANDFAFFGFRVDRPEELDDSGFSIIITGYEGYALDNLTVASAVSSVPLPGGLPLFLSGLLGFIFLRKPTR